MKTKMPNLNKVLENTLNYYLIEKDSLERKIERLNQDLESYSEDLVETMNLIKEIEEDLSARNN